MTEQPERKLTRQKKWSDAHAQKTWAHSALRSALRRGLIERKPCEVCGADKAEGHHPDYDRPMLVKWLCAKHHKEEHRRLKGGADAQS